MQLFNDGKSAEPLYKRLVPLKEKLIGADNPELIPLLEAY